MDFEAINRALLARGPDVVMSWFPQGRQRGREILVGDLAGNPGESLSINTETGRWADFANGEAKGGDLISLFAAKEGLSQGEAARRLAEEVGVEVTKGRERSPKVTKGNQKSPPNWGYTPAPPGTTRPNINGAAGCWAYTLPGGAVATYVVRENQADGKKTFYPLSYTRDGAWVRKAPPAPRPLYRLDEIMAHPDRPVLVVEGEKAADAARALVGDRYVVTTSMNGSSGAKNADWGPIEGRAVIVHPDADKAGVAYANAVAGIAHALGCQVKVFDVSDRPAGWDLADAQAEGWDWDRYYAWGASRIHAWAPGTASASVQIAAVASGPGATVNVSVEAPEDSAEIDGATIVAWKDLDLQLTKKGDPFCNANNVLACLEGFPRFAGRAWWDDFHETTFKALPDGSRREWTDADSVDILIELQRNCGLANVTSGVVAEGLSAWTRAHRRNEVRDWFDSLVWDKTPRVAGYFATYCGAEDSAYTHSVARNWFVSMVARVCRPGCQVDSMPVLIGPQGCGKSSSLRALGGEWYGSASASIEEKDFRLALKGKILVELSELGALSKADASRIKAVISDPIDRYRVPYGRLTEDHPRKSVFAGTTNQDQPLRDETGARRFWPVEVSSIDVAAIIRDRDQLFAEAVAMYQAGEPWHEVPAGETAAKHEEHREADAWEDAIRQWWQTGDCPERVTTREIARRALQIEVSELGVAEQRRIGAAMRVLGWARHHGRDADGLLQRYWVKPERVPF